ncbi:hypothetical protein [Silvimonas sp.]|uniref:hypothetical protein n=1 Tax=Silvimonas sp. TaxID=2650811 RepID=UPI00284FE4FC|nr:hypothetical protein [Silvimonas sp.]MDR3427825.1 hypothetical protein [Silvimonas sp.]
MSNTVQGWEPAADRPYTMALSAAEVHALINHHINQTKRLTKIVGNKLLKLRSSTILPSRRQANAYIEEGQKIVSAHIARAQTLQAILKARPEVRS